MPTEKTIEKTIDTKPAYTPRRLKLITKSARGWDYLIDADTGEDLRLPADSVRVQPLSVGGNVHLTMGVVAVEREQN